MNRLLTLRMSTVLMLGAWGAPVFAQPMIEAEPDLIYPIQEYNAKARAPHRAYRAGDYERAFDLFQIVARWGEKDSQFKLATMYIEGKGTSPDVIEGYAWLKTAAESGNRKMNELMYRLVEVMSEEELEFGEELAEEYIANYGMAARDMRCIRRQITGTHQKVLECRKRYTH